MDQILDALDWVESPAPPDADGLPYVTHTGVLKMLGLEIEVHQLSSGERVIAS